MMSVLQINAGRKARHFVAGASLAFALCARPAIAAAAAPAESRVPESGPARIFPDYSGVAIPPNIAPLNFRIQEQGAAYEVQIRSVSGPPIRIRGRKPEVAIPARAWRELLRANPGQPLWTDVSVQDSGGAWKPRGSITNAIAREEIDGYLVYRRLKPLYNTYYQIGIYQRNLASFEERPVLKNQSFDRGCLNCHTFLDRRADHFALNIRADTNGNPMLLVRSNEVIRVNNTAGYLAWHPSGRLLTFSANKLILFFHTAGETREVFDRESNLGIYRVDSNVVVTPPAIALPDRNENWPAWDPDGRFLYYCSAAPMPVDHYRKVRYDLMRISYDIEGDRWGQPEALLASEASGASAALPRISPDGRWALFCLFPYGNFPIYQPGSDLYVMDLQTLRHRRLEINSDQADTWHCWSGNSRWIVFSSKRRDGLFARPYFSYVDQQGKFHKPFLLPQQDPSYYDACLDTFNVPELVREAIRVTPGELADAILRPRNVRTPPSDARHDHVGEEFNRTKGGARNPQAAGSD